MPRERGITIPGSVIFLIYLIFQVPAFGQSQPKIAGAINSEIRAPLAGPRLVPSGARDLGTIKNAAELEHLMLVLSMSETQQHNAISLLDSQQTRGSAQYHKWLTPEEFGQRFGPAPQDIKTIADWLAAQGFTVNAVAKSGLWIDFSGTAGQTGRAFATSLHNYQLGTESFIANANDASIPAALAPLVSGLVTLNNYYRQRPLHVRGIQVRQNSAGKYEPIPGQTAATGPNGSLNLLSPGDFARIYDLNPLYQGQIAGRTLNGADETIAIVARSDINTQDVTDFRNAFGVPPNGPPTVINIGPDVPFDPQNSDAVEATLDAEWAGAVAPAANVQVVVSGSTFTDGVDISAAYIVDNDLAPVVSVSFGLCEHDLGPAGNQFFSSLWQQAAAQGMTVLVASGDSGAAGCDPATPLNTVVAGTGARFGLAVSGLASTPFTTSVGGTQFNEDGAGESPSPGTSTATFWSAGNDASLVNALGYIPEKVWNESCITPPFAQPGSQCFIPGIALGGIYVLQGGGGGLSTLYSPPSWQTINLVGLTGSGFTNRAMPDVSLTADPVHDPYLICFNGSCSSATNKSFVAIGGTSAAAPSFAGIMAIVDQAAGSPQGLANYVLYPMAAQEDFTACNSNTQINPAQSNGCVFHDTTIGNNGQPGNDLSNVPAAGALGYPATAGYDAATGLGSVDATNLVSTWLALQQGFQGTTTALSTSGTSISATHGSAVPVSVQVNADAGTKAPGGAVSFIAQGGSLTGNIGLGDGALTAGTGSSSFTGSLVNLPGGTYGVIARYPGDGSFAASDSLPIPVTISPESSVTSTVLFAPGTGPVNGLGVGYGEPVTIQATVAGASGQGIATGKVTLMQNGTQVSSVTLDSFSQAHWATCPTFASPIRNTFPCLTPGTYSITATYSGDNSFSSSPQPAAPSQTVAITVNRGDVFPLIFRTDPCCNPVVLNQPFKLTTLVQGQAGNPPTGTVQFSEGTTSLGQATVAADGSASLQITLPQGTHNITGAYSGDSNWRATTNTGQVNVGVPFGYVIPAQTQSVQAGQTATYNLTLVAAPGVTGDVTLSCSSADAPAGVTCNIPRTISFTSTTNSVPLTVTVQTLTTARLNPAPFATLPFAFGAVLLSGLGLRKKKSRRWMAGIFAVILVCFTSSCGGGTSVPPPPPTKPPTAVTFTIDGSIPVSATESIDEFVTLDLNITH